MDLVVDAVDVVGAVVVDVVEDVVDVNHAYLVDVGVVVIRPSVRRPARPSAPSVHPPSVRPPAARPSVRPPARPPLPLTARSHSQSQSKSITQAWNAKQPDSIYGVGLFCMECLAGRFRVLSSFLRELWNLFRVLLECSYNAFAAP